MATVEMVIPARRSGGDTAVTMKSGWLSNLVGRVEGGKQACAVDMHEYSRR